MNNGRCKSLCKSPIMTSISSSMHDNHHHRHHPKIHVMEKKEFGLPPFFFFIKNLSNSQGKSGKCVSVVRRGNSPHEEEGEGNERWETRKKFASWQSKVYWVTSRCRLPLNHPRQSCQGTLGKGGNFIVDIIAAARRSSLGIDMIFPI